MPGLDPRDTVTPNESPIAGEGLVGETRPGVVAQALPDERPIQAQSIGTVQDNVTPSTESSTTEQSTAQDPDPTWWIDQAEQVGSQRSKQVEDLTATNWISAMGSAAKMTDTFNLGKAAYDKLTEGFEPAQEDPDFDLQEYLLNADTLLNTDERAWLHNRNPKSKQDADQYLQVIERERELSAVTQLYPKSSFATMLLDPVYVLPAGAALKAARVARMGKIGAAGMGAAAEAGMMGLANTQRHVTQEEFFLTLGLGALANFAFTPRRGSYPDRQLREAIIHDTARFQEHLDKVNTTMHDMVYSTTEFVDTPKLRPVEVGGEWRYYPDRNTITKETPQGARDVPQVKQETVTVTRSTDPTKINPKHSAYTSLKRVVDNPKVPEMIRAGAQQLLDIGAEALKHVNVRHVGTLRGKYGDYSWPTHEIRIRGTSKDLTSKQGQRANTIVHEALHALTAWKFSEGAKHVSQGRDTAHARLFQEIDDLFKQTKAQAKKQGLDTQDYYTRYAFDNPYEFMAVMYSNHRPLFEFLKTLDPEGIPALRGQQRSLAGEMHDAMRRLWGMDLEDANAFVRGLELTEDLARTPLEIRYDLGTGDVRHVGMSVESPAQIAQRTESQVGAMAEVQTAVQSVVSAVTKDGPTKALGKSLAWNWFKSASKIDPEFASKWLSDPLRSNAGNNISSSRRAIRAQFTDIEVQYHAAMRQYFFENGLTWKDLAVNWKKTRAVQTRMESELLSKLSEWENLSRMGRDIPVEDTALYRVAELHDKAMKLAAEQGIAAGILPDSVAHRSGYFPRKFDSYKLAEIESRLGSILGDEAAARTHLANELANNFRDMPDLTRKDRVVIARAIMDRARRQGELQDLSFRGHMGLEIVSAVRDQLQRSGMKHKDIQRVTDMLEGKVDQSGKAAYQKNRLDINMDGDINLPGGQGSVKVSDLLDQNMTLSLRNYLDDISGRLAMAEHGIKNTSDIDKARQSFVSKAQSTQQRQEANTYFEATVNAILGRPIGEALHPMLRYVSAFTQMTSLRNSGFWQITEFAFMMQRYGALVGTPKMVREVFGSLAGMNKFLERPENASHLAAVLSRNTYNDLRFRPFVDKLDDGHMVTGNTALGGVTYMSQYVYVANGMRFVMRKQAQAAANLLVHSLEQASKGNQKLKDFFGKYGIDDATLQEVQAQYNSHGWSLDKWDAGVYEKVRSPLMTIIDEDVLRARTGEVPALAQFSSVGRVLFTFRSFIISSHNKILSSGLANDGAKAMAVVFAYQSMLSALMVQLANVSAGKGPIQDDSAWANRTVSMMGSIGLLAEAFSIISGDSNQFGNPFMLSTDKLYRTGNYLGATEWGKAAETAADAVPLASLIPGWGAAVKYAFD